MSYLRSYLSDENQKSEDSLKRRSRTEEKSQFILEEIYNVAEVRHQSTVPKRVTSTDRHSLEGSTTSWCWELVRPLDIVFGDAR